MNIPNTQNTKDYLIATRTTVANVVAEVFTFEDEKDSVELKNIGNDNITLTISGTDNIVAPGETYFEDGLSTLTVTVSAASDSQGFTIVGIKDQSCNTEVDELSEKLETFTKRDYLTDVEIYEPPTASNTFATDATGRILDVTSAEFEASFYEAHIGTHFDGLTVTKQVLGLDESGTYEISEYAFTPSSYSRTIMLSSGMHTYELSAHFGLAHFIQQLMTDEYQHALFKYIRNNVRVLVIPIINPWGWNQNPKTYGNSNGVNINRNFDYDGKWLAYEGNTNEYDQKGTSPFSENETQILRDWVIANNNSEFWIDCHTGLGLGPFDTFLYHLSDTPLYDDIYSAIDKLEARLLSKYGESTPTRSIVIDSQGSIRHWFSQDGNGLPTFTLEQTPNNLLWGTSLNNEAGDITEFSVSIGAFLSQLLAPGIMNDTDLILNLSKKISALEIGEVYEEFSVSTGTQLTYTDLTGDAVVDPPTEGSILFQDTFTQVDGTINATALETGSASWSAIIGQFSTVSNKVSETTNSLTGTVLFDSLLTDYSCEMVFNWGAYVGEWLRYTDSSNNLMVRMSDTSLAVYERDNVGAGVNIGEHLLTPVLGTEYNLKVILDGININVYLDDVLVITTTTTVTTGTLVGIRTASDTLSKIDSFTIRALA